MHLQVFQVFQVFHMPCLTWKPLWSGHSVVLEVSWTLCASRGAPAFLPQFPELWMWFLALRKKQVQCWVWSVGVCRWMCQAKSAQQWDWFYACCFTWEQQMALLIHQLSPVGTEPSRKLCVWSPCCWHWSVWPADLYKCKRLIKLLHLFIFIMIYFGLCGSSRGFLRKLFQKFKIAAD